MTLSETPAASGEEEGWMTAGLKSTAHAWIWKELTSRFERCGWVLQQTAEGGLNIVSSPMENVEETLLISQPFRPQELPRQDAVGVSCTVNVYFAELEHLINGKLGRNPAGMGRVSTTIRLSQLAPEQHLFARNVYVVPVAAGEFTGAVDQLLDDYDTYVEPVRQRLSHANVFEDD
jgi:hypothetical protein